MTKQTRTHVFRLLLIIMMVIQPVAIAHAMTMVDCAQDHAMVAGPSVQHGHQQMQQASPDRQLDGHDAAHHMKDCCNTSTCCSVVAIVDTVTLAYISAHTDSAYAGISWQSVFIPSELKPPRHRHV